MEYDELYQNLESRIGRIDERLRETELATIRDEEVIKNNTDAINNFIAKVDSWSENYQDTLIRLNALEITLAETNKALTETNKKFNSIKVELDEKITDLDNKIVEIEDKTKFDFISYIKNNLIGIVASGAFLFYVLTK